MDQNEILAVLAAKVTLLEHAVRFLIKEKYLQTDDPVGQAKHAAEELKKFFNPQGSDSLGVLHLQQAVDNFFDVLVGDLKSDLGNQKEPPQE